MNKIETWAPVFSGFYNTIWEFNGDEDELQYLNENAPKGKEYTYDDLDIDYRAYEKDVCTRFVDILSATLSEGIPAIKKIVMQQVISPKEYNFRNDAIDIEIHVHSKTSLQKWIINYLKKHKDEWLNYLVSHYTGCDGFIPGYSNSPLDWKNKTENYSNLGTHHLGAILQFYCDTEYLDEDYFYDKVIESIYANEYIKLKEAVSG